MKTLLFIIFLFITSNMMAQTQKKLDKAIQGTWQIKGNSPDGKHPWTMEWTFEKGKFKHTSKYAPERNGKYKVVSTEDNVFHLKLIDSTEPSGSTGSDFDVTIEDKTHLNIGGREGFEKVESLKKK